MRAVLSLASLLVCASCSQVSQEEKECRSDIKGKLINPETVEFFDFSSISKSEFRTGLINMKFKDSGVSRGERPNFGNQVKVIADDVMQIAVGPYYGLRVKAESKVGLKVTMHFVCTKVVEGCACLNGDE